MERVKHGLVVATKTHGTNHIKNSTSVAKSKLFVAP
jgi:hypothetical protein